MSNINVAITGGPLIVAQMAGAIVIEAEISKAGPTPALPEASADVLGGIKVGENLKIENGVLSVDTESAVLEDNTKPITSGAVHTELGNIEALLAAL